MSTSVVAIDNLVKRYGDKVAVDHFSLNVQEGEILGLLGPNGSGKTTTINCLLSLLQYDKGTVTIFDKEMKPEAYDIKSQIGVVMQNVAVVDTLNVYENVDFFCGLYIKNKALRKKYVEEALEFTGLSEYKKYKPQKLSGGLLRRLNIACGIAHKPKLIIFDEPTVAVDPQSRNAILEGIRKMNKAGATIIYTSHYMEEVEELCTRVVIMDHGRNVASGTSQELKSSLISRETIRVGLPDRSDKIIGDIKEINHVYKVKEDGDDLVIKCDGGEHNLVHILGYLTDNHIPFGHVSTQLPSLNDVFLEITGKELRD
ncbi:MULTISPECIES: ABC transporter ATP-binding protein [Butyrivibrio]|jgi:ABC-2 type transport system ATP-binding protein|uniref:ABC-2 type transport system ATP-binding protein n=1 Tax=Butyrivibrio fibrisolvens TaxID=831 RepID=A0A1H9SJQ8_BUTFI|nr:MULTISPECIES: ABC transporter ATP-binding protein [Butyrivibrio]MBQ1458455.1 ABC transporter ATP-binding protein [Butyrivibrio sp.]MCR5770998.1 ABC transporter ATP-binding protein [Butyrivibrio sp.]SEQ32288.1 ABC-2 type transport system ATP-binding protein [Butyrivibrio sp. TB]SER85260.1 ABC-2 type transport system ATP-binding protein [Butyrivibrio fibrisolvens]